MTYQQEQSMRWVEIMSILMDIKDSRDRVLNKMQSTEEKMERSMTAGTEFLTKCRAQRKRWKGACETYKKKMN
ncbi:hypothetical protein E2320_008046 [Naja naja]|nr:hypothetical protein E2320_008046 [Naja naja]